MGADYEHIISKLRSMADPECVKEMARFGINPSNNLGVSVSVIREMAHEIGMDHELAGRLWDSGIHDARILAAWVDDPALVTEEQMERWAGDFDSWDVCDQVCSHLFDRTRFAYGKALEWSRRDEEFVKRAGFVVMAAIAVHDKKAGDDSFTPFLEAVERCSRDDRNYVKKAVNWALRQIGKRNQALNGRALGVARRLKDPGNPSARWIASDAIRELTGEKVRTRLARKAKKTGDRKPRARK